MMAKIDEHLEALIKQMTLDEKIALCSGKDCWNTNDVNRLGIHSFMVSDGPHGLRKQIGAMDNLGIGESEPAVCFPTASALACSFDKSLLFEVGKAIGEECIDENVAIILGPGVNQKRSPLCGRNFEYYSEDPLVSGELGASMIQGVQSTGTMACVKHFAVNNQEEKRMTINAIIDERALRETYLKSFEIAVKKGRPDTIMCAYNRLNGAYCSENNKLLTEILRDEWGFEGAVISDWGAVHNRVMGLEAGLDLEMPGNRGFHNARIAKAIQSGELSMKSLDRAVKQLMKLSLKADKLKTNQDLNAEPINKNQAKQELKIKNHELAIQALVESAVLLKNHSQLLPGHADQKIAIIGALAKTPRYQGAGSSKIHPFQIDTPYQSLVTACADVEYAEGYSLKKTDENDVINHIQKACLVAKDKDRVYVFLGLPEGYESEGFDRKDLNLPKEQNQLMEALVRVSNRIVVILMGGSPMQLPWIDQVPSVLLTYLGGEGIGQAVKRLLLGEANPSGRLAETWPLTVEDTPCYHYYPGGKSTVEYRESIFVGYRYYDTANIPVLFSFGHGLSYTQFQYDHFKIKQKMLSSQGSIDYSFDVKNIGNIMGKETILLYTAHMSKGVMMPKRELRDFIKIELLPGESQTIEGSIRCDHLNYYDVSTSSWKCSEGVYHLMIHHQEALREIFYLKEDDTSKPVLEENTSLEGELFHDSRMYLENRTLRVSDDYFEALYGQSIPKDQNVSQRPFTWDNTLEDIQGTFIGKIILKFADQQARKISNAEAEQEGMMVATIKQMPFFSLVPSSEGVISEGMMEAILACANGHLIRGTGKLLKALIKSK